MGNLESHRIRFPGLKRHGIQVWLMESHGKCYAIAQNLLKFVSLRTRWQKCTHSKSCEEMEKVLETSWIFKSSKACELCNKWYGFSEPYERMYAGRTEVLRALWLVDACHVTEYRWQIITCHSRASSEFIYSSTVLSDFQNSYPKQKDNVQLHCKSTTRRKPPKWLIQESYPKRLSSSLTP